MRSSTLVTPAPPQAPVANHRQRFETFYHALPQDARVHAAATVSDPDLSALCFDPLPAVIHGILDNPQRGLIHARLIAAHHANPVGLQALAGYVPFLQDREVQRLLLRNIQTPEHVVRNLFGSRPLADVFHFTRSHELPDHHRVSATRALGRRFGTATPEQRVELILTTDGRALAALSSTALDGRSVAMLCSRGSLSHVLIENLARWPATPPRLIAHLLKQPLVGKSPALKLAIRRHPNCPPGV